MKLNISKGDWANVKKAVAQGGKIWDNPLLKDFKRKVKDYNRHLQSEQCCYCRRSLADEFNLVIDIEHVLPKGQFDTYMFEFFNLSVSCKRCNMEIKGEDISFIMDVNNPKNAASYKLIHPNFDDYFQHIRYYVKTVNTKSIVKYTVLNDSSKGEFTYDYFELSEIESESLNQAQGIKVSEKISNSIDPRIANEISKLLKANLG